MKVRPGENYRQKSLKIYTLGSFQVKRDSKLLTQEGHSYRIWSFFKYLITYRDKRANPEAVLEVLRPDQFYEDPRRAARAIIHRLRKALKGDSQEENSHIKNSQGCYYWDQNSDYWLDVEEFEELYHMAQSIAPQSPEEAIDLYKRALDLYKGDYLFEDSFSEWVIPARNYYHRLFTQIVLDLCGLLKRQGRYGEIIDICQRAIIIEPFEENFHLYFLESLLEEGKIRQAMEHHQHFVNSFYREMGVDPSPAMNKLYQRIKGGGHNKGVLLELPRFQEELKEKREVEGAFLCDPETFKNLYKLEERRGERTGQPVFLVLLTLVYPEKEKVSSDYSSRAMNFLQKILVTSLRKGDVISPWNNYQFMIILTSLKLEEAQGVLKRIKGTFEKSFDNNRINLQSRLQPVFPDD